MNASCVDRALTPVRSANCAEEARLIEGLLAGRTESWREFTLRYTRMIEACIARVTTRFPGLCGQEDIREIYALFCLNLLSNESHRLRSYNPARGTRFSSWLGLIAVHTAYDYLRAARRQPQGPCVDDVADLVAHVPEVTDSFERRQQAKQITRLVEELSPRDREFMSLYFGQGMTPEAVAAKMGISVKTVYTKKHKIRSKLEALIGQQRAAA